MDRKVPSAIKYQPLISEEQKVKLRQTALHAYNYSPFWKKIFDQHIVAPSTMNTDAFFRLPVMTKATLQDHLPEMICTDKSAIIDYVCTSGTTSHPVNLPQTESDLQRLAENEYQAILYTGASYEDVFQICTTLDKQFMAGMAYFLGLRKLGAAVIRVGVESLERQWNTILNLQPTYLIAVPSFVVKLILYAIENNIDYKGSSVKKILCIGESIRYADFSLNAMGQRIASLWEVTLFATYASTEMATSFTECEFRKGGHHNSDLLIVEILDENNQNVPYGTIGELTVTTLGIEGVPLFRYKTGDLCTLHDEACDCGRDSIRISPILGRTSQRVKYKGTSVYLSAVFDILNKFNEVHDYLIIIRKGFLGTDELEIHLAPSVGECADRVRNTLRNHIRVTPDILFHQSLMPIRNRHEVHNKRKLTQVIDLREDSLNI